MRYTQLKAFDAVSREGSFSAAADRIGLTQPALTIQVRELEQTYSVKLFERYGRGVKLTETGHELFKQTQEMFEIENKARDYLESSLELKTGELRVSADGPHAVMSMIAQFRDQYPGIKLSITLGNAHTVWRDLIEQRADVIIAANPPQDARVRTWPMINRTLVLVVKNDHEWASRKEVAISEIIDQPVIVREPSSNTSNTLTRILKKAKVKIKPIMELGSREGVCEAVAEGLGIGFAFKHEIGRDDRIQALKLKDIDSETCDFVACFEAQKERRVIKAFLDIANEFSVSAK